MPAAGMEMDMEEADMEEAASGERGTNGDSQGCLREEKGPVFKTSPSNAGGIGLIPGQGTKIPQASWQKKTKTKTNKQTKKTHKITKAIL